tara:strand:+ start:631 stop:1023 length:393 start_codon:yes stop_codon:yes gene_type:complete
LVKDLEVYEKNYLLYDGECPVCKHYVLWTNLRLKHPGIDLLNARDHQQLVNKLRLEGIEINDTMVLSVAGKRLVGSQAMAQLSEYMQPVRLHQKFLKKITRDEKLLRVFYPFMVAGRKLLLLLLGRKKIS